MTSIRGIALHPLHVAAKPCQLQTPVQKMSKVASDREIKFTEADIKSFIKEHENAENTKIKKETSCS